MESACELTILMPCLNEAETIAICIKKAKQFLLTEGVQGEVLIADNGSTDGSQQIAENAGARVVPVAVRGYGAALREGIRQSRGAFIIMGDADDSYDFLNLKPFLNKLRAGYDLVMGNRFRGGIMDNAMPFLNRYVGNPVLSFIGRKFFKSPIGDFHCGLRGFSARRFQELELTSDGMEFASEMIAKATLKKYSIAEVPTQLHPDGRSRRPHLRPWRDGWRHLRLLLLLSPRWLFLYPGVGLALFGLMLLLFLMGGPRQVGGVNFGIHTMLFGGLFVVIGCQAITFAAFTKIMTGTHQQNKSSRIYWFTLERGLLIGLLFVLLGIAGASYSLWFWSQQSFGSLIPAETMREVIPSVVSIIFGAQLMFASFFGSILQLNLETVVVREHEV